MKYVRVVEPERNFRGLNYGQWASIWCNWLLSEDLTDQRGGILFLRGNVDYGPVAGVKGAPLHVHPQAFYDRTGARGETIFLKTPIFFPVLNAIISAGDIYDGRVIKSENEMRFAAHRDIVEGGSMWATICKMSGGRSTNIVGRIKDFFIESPLFELRIPKESTLRKKMENPTRSGRIPSVTAGYYLLATFESTGLFRLEFGGNGRGAYRTNARYDIRVIDE